MLYTSATRKRKTPQGIKSLSSNLSELWWLGILDITRSSVTSTLHDETELENYLNEQEGKYHKVCANCFDCQKLQGAIGNKKSISGVDNSTEPSLSLSHSF